MRKKQQRFEANEKNPLCIQEGKPFFKKAKGNWAHFFGNQGPIFLELGCGSGRYTVALAHQYPEKNFVGIDIKGARIFQGSMEAKEKGSKNLAFLRTRIEAIEDFFAPNEVAGLYITFPDPRPKKRDQKRRLTSPHFFQKRCNGSLPLYPWDTSGGGASNSPSKQRFASRFSPHFCRKKSNHL